jgi:hypothetical protein
MKELTFNQYRNIDVFILSFLTAVFEFIAAMATNRWFVLQAMSISIVPAMICITAFRWGKYACFPSFVGAIAYCIASRGSTQQLAIYCLGSFFCLLAIPALKKIGKEKARLDFIHRSAFAILVYLSVTIGRWICSLLFEFSIKSLLPFILTDALSLIFAIVVLTFVRNVDGLIEDQKSYLLRLDRERKEEEAANLNDPF